MPAGVAEPVPSSCTVDRLCTVWGAPALAVAGSHGLLSTVIVSKLAASPLRVVSSNHQGVWLSPPWSMCGATIDACALSAFLIVTEGPEICCHW